MYTIRPVTNTPASQGPTAKIKGTRKYMYVMYTLWDLPCLQCNGCNNCKVQMGKKILLKILFYILNILLQKLLNKSI